MKLSCAIIFCCASLLLNAQSIKYYNHFLKNNNQVVFVKTNSDSSIHAAMFLYERKNAHKKWKLIDSFNAVVGQNGLAKDVTSKIIFNKTMPLKQEGDGRSPAGIFDLGPVFSYHSMQGLHMPFIKADTNYICIDDVNSVYYNTLVKKDTVSQHDYNSFEYMRRTDSLYEYGVWVKYNSNDITPGNGSCIFIHIWRNENSGTAGCTASTKENILKIIYWLNEKKKPVLLQVEKQNRLTYKPAGLN